MINVKGFSGVWHKVSLLSRIRKGEREEGAEEGRKRSRGGRQTVRSSLVVMGTPQAPEPALGDTLRLKHRAQELFLPSSVSKAGIPK